MFADVGLDPLGLTASTGYVPRDVASSVAPPGIERSLVAGVSGTSSTRLLSLRNPLTWFAIFAAATFGLVGLSSTTRVGPARANLKIGKS